MISYRSKEPEERGGNGGRFPDVLLGKSKGCAWKEAEDVGAGTG